MTPGRDNSSALLCFFKVKKKETVSYMMVHVQYKVCRVQLGMLGTVIIDDTGTRQYNDMI